jgi:hypothetical protein
MCFLWSTKWGFYILENDILHSHHRGNLRSDIVIKLSPYSSPMLRAVDWSLLGYAHTLPSVVRPVRCHTRGTFDGKLPKISRDDNSISLPFSGYVTLQTCPTIDCFQDYRYMKLEGGEVNFVGSWGVGGLWCWKMTKWPPSRAEAYPRTTPHKLSAIMCVYVEANSTSSPFSCVKKKVQW